VVDGIGAREEEKWTERERDRERERELGFELAALIGFLWGPWWAGPVRRTRPGVSVPPHIRPTFRLDMRGACQTGHLFVV